MGMNKTDAVLVENGQSPVEQSPNIMDQNKEHFVDESPVGQKVDKHGLPLVPQPTDYKDDPLVR